MLNLKLIHKGTQRCQITSRFEHNYYVTVFPINDYKRQRARERDLRVLERKIVRTNSLQFDVSMKTKVFCLGYCCNIVSYEEHFETYLFIMGTAVLSYNPQRRRTLAFDVQPMTSSLLSQIMFYCYSYNSIMKNKKNIY